MKSVEQLYLDMYDVSCAIAWHSTLEGEHDNAVGDAVRRLRISFLFITRAHIPPEKQPKENTLQTYNTSYDGVSHQ